MAYRVKRLCQVHKYQIKVLVLFPTFLLQLLDSEYHVNSTILGPVAALALQLKALGQSTDSAVYYPHQNFPSNAK